MLVPTFDHLVPHFPIIMSFHNTNSINKIREITDKTTLLNKKTNIILM